MPKFEVSAIRETGCPGQFVFEAYPDNCAWIDLNRQPRPPSVKPGCCCKVFYEVVRMDGFSFRDKDTRREITPMVCECWGRIIE